MYMSQINPYRKELDKKRIRLIIPNGLKHHFAVAVSNQVDVIQLSKNHLEEFSTILNAIQTSADQDVEIELPSSFVKYVLWKPIRDIFEKDITAEETAGMKAFYKSVYHQKPNAFVSCGK